VSFLRLGSVFAASLLLLGTPSQAACPSSLEEEVLLLVNQERAAHNLPPLVMDDRLLVAAKGHALDMATHDFVSHTGSDGSSAAQRIVAAGYQGSWGENAAGGYTTPAAVVDAWMGSTGHRANILSPNFDHIGVGWAYQAGTTYRNYQVQAFGGGAALVAACDGSPPSSGGGPDALASCQSSQLKALSRLLSSHFSCAGKFVARPDKDPLGAKRAACLDKAEDRFERDYEKARIKAAQDLTACGLDDSASAVAASVESEAEPVSAGVLAGFDIGGFDPKDSADREDARLRAALLRETGRLLQKALTAESRHAAKPDAGKRDSERQNVRDQFDDRSAKALSRAQARGASYSGTDAVSLGDGCEDAVDDWVTTTAP
jgi:hypothetical protein